MKKLVVLMLLMALATAGCAGLTAREKGALVGGSGGAAGGALLGAAAGNAAIGAAIGGPVGLIGGVPPGRQDLQGRSGSKEVGWRSASLPHGDRPRKRLESSEVPRVVL